MNEKSRLLPHVLEAIVGCILQATPLLQQNSFHESGIQFLIVLYFKVKLLLFHTITCLLNWRKSLS